MDQRELLKKIGDEGEPCRGRDIFSSHIRREEISFEDYLNHKAILVADTVAHYPLVPYRPIPEIVLRYVNQRLAHACDYDVALARPLGHWFFDMIRAHEENTSNLSLFLWAKARCQKIELSDKVKIIDQAIACMEIDNFPFYIFERASEVKRRDAIARDCK